MTDHDHEDWLQVTIDATPHTAEDLSEALEAAGAMSVTLEDAAGDPVFEPAPGETVLWPQIRATGLFAPEADAAGVVRHVQQALGLPAPPACRVKRLAERDWSRVWLEHFRPMRFGRRLWICPTGAAPPEPHAVTVFLDPGLAFGTGTHATTALCLEWLDAHSVEGRTVLDYGCGSGILALAAAALGAEHVWAVDNDPQALKATRENARKNSLEGRVTTTTPAGLAAPAMDCVLANILARPLIELAPTLGRLAGGDGHLVLTGILPAQARAVVAAYEDAFELESQVERDGWTLLAARRRGV